jgi:predicted AlkP superfamily phosphohydrolase/phosphomutase
VLAIGVDAAEGSLVRQLTEQGEMPALRSLLLEGQWLRVDSPAHIGSGAVWPTFMSGHEPAVHSVYSEWRWQPVTMSLTRYNGRHLTPFWKPLAEQDVPVGVFDVPFALPVGLTKGFEVCEWWAHDATDIGLQCGPRDIFSLVRDSPAHPLSANRFVDTTPDNLSNLEELTAACVEGVHLRGRLAGQLIREAKPYLALMVFPELHHAGHLMWHTVDPDHHFYRHRRLVGRRGHRPLLKKVYQALDKQIGDLLKLADSHATVMVFALHGMRPALGFPGFLNALLCERGFSRLENWASQTWRKRALSLLAATKQHTPDSLKQLYYKTMPTTATHKLARPTMLPIYDWKRTRAFSLPTDQYGWIRVNLMGREAQGSVALDEYEETCDQIQEMLLNLVTEDGRQIVRDINRTATTESEILKNLLPDLVVHWEEAAFDWPLKIKASQVQAEPVAKKATGQHASEGFCIYRGAALENEGVVAAKDLGRLMIASISRQASVSPRTTRDYVRVIS